jgi:hypothetical protein
MEKYFDKFPKIQYSNNEVVDITKRATLLDKVYNNPLAYYPYAISSEERADQLSERYYKDSYQSWLIYFANKIIDPYYEWYLHEREFNDYIVKKYGSYFRSQQKIKHYKNNWSFEESLTVSGYDALATNQQKYWQPVYGYSNSVVSYKRKELDWVINTNKIVSYDVENSDGFLKEEICFIVFDNTYSGKGQISFSSNNVLCLKNISGTFIDGGDVSISGSSYIYGTESETNTVFTTSTLIVNNIQPEEEVYWRPISYFEYEADKNDFNKTVQIIDNSLAQIASDNLKDLMKG